MLQMCSFDGSKSTKGASKLRRDLINAEIANLRDLLPLPSSTRQRLSQLQLMALVCVYVRKSNYFQQVFRKLESNELSIPNFGFSKALSGFLMMMTQNGKLLYISDNAAEYLGHSMEDLLIHGDSVYDIIDKADHAGVQTELLRPSAHHHHHHHQGTLPLGGWAGEERMFLCRMNVSRNARRQMRFGDQKVVLIRGHFLSFLPLCSRNEPVFLATCSPVAMPETRECVVQGTTAIFTSLHSMDMKFLHIDTNGEYHLGVSAATIQGSSWYQLLHWENLKEAQHKHRMITQAEADRACILLVRMHSPLAARWLWVHVVLQVKDNMEGVQHPVIVCTNQVLSEREAEVMRGNSWLYHYYAMHKQHYADSSAPMQLPPLPPLPPPPTGQLLLAYPLANDSSTHPRQPNGGRHANPYNNGSQQQHNAGPTYTRLDNAAWPAVQLSGGGATLLTHAVRHPPGLRAKWRPSQEEATAEEETEVSSPQHTVPEMLHNRYNDHRCQQAEQHVPELARRQPDNTSLLNSLLAETDLYSLPLNKHVRGRCLCNINTCLSLCTCSRYKITSAVNNNRLPIDVRWTFCCTSGASSSNSEEEEEDEEERSSSGTEVEKA